MYEILNNLDMSNLISDSPYKYMGNNVPRVTKVLSFINDEYIIPWANYIGYYKRIKYKDEMEKSCFIGSNVHEGIEYFLQNKIINEEKLLSINNIDTMNKIKNGIESFKLWYNDICHNNIEILGIEQELVCPWFGGTYDLLMKINNKIYLVDFKTSNHVGYKYFMQLAAYRFMLKNYYNINIDGCIILQVKKDKIEYEEYCLLLDNPIHKSFLDLCEQGFIYTLNALIYKINIENEFKKIFK